LGGHRCFQHFLVDWRQGRLIGVSPPGHTAGILVGKARVSATNKVRIAFGNLTAGSLSPPAGAYLFSVTR